MSAENEEVKKTDVDEDKKKADAIKAAAEKKAEDDAKAAAEKEAAEADAIKAAELSEEELKESLVEEALGYGIAAKSVLSRYSNERLESEINQAKRAERVELWHGLRSHIIVDKSQVEAHLKAGWRTEK